MRLNIDLNKNVCRIEINEETQDANRYYVSTGLILFLDV